MKQKGTESFAESIRQVAITRHLDIAHFSDIRDWVEERRSRLKLVQADDYELLPDGNILVRFDNRVRSGMRTLCRHGEAKRLFRGRYEFCFLKELRGGGEDEENSNKELDREG